MTVFLVTPKCVKKLVLPNLDLCLDHWLGYSMRWRSRSTTNKLNHFIPRKRILPILDFYSAWLNIIIHVVFLVINPFSFDFFRNRFDCFLFWFIKINLSLKFYIRKKRVAGGVGRVLEMIMKFLNGRGELKMARKMII